MFPSLQQRSTPNVFCFLYVNGWSLSWKLLHYQLCELTWARRQRHWIPNNCLAGKGEEGWEQPLESREHLWKCTLRGFFGFFFLHCWMSQIGFGEQEGSWVILRAPLPGRRSSNRDAANPGALSLLCAGYPCLPSEGRGASNSCSI